MFVNGELDDKLDYAIFADTQEEPESVYSHLEWLKSLGGPPILTDTAGKPGDDPLRLRPREVCEGGNAIQRGGEPALASGCRSGIVTPGSTGLARIARSPCMREQG